MFASHGVNPVLCLLLHELNARAAVPVGQNHRAQGFLCMIYLLVGNGRLLTLWEWDVHPKFTTQCVVCIAPFSVLPIEQYDQVEAFSWLKYPPGGD